MNKGIFFKVLIFIFSTVNTKTQPLKQSCLKGTELPRQGGSRSHPRTRPANRQHVHVKPGIDARDLNTPPLSLCLLLCTRELHVAVGSGSALQVTRRGASVGQAQPDAEPGQEPGSQPARVWKAAGAETRWGGRSRARRVQPFSWAWWRTPAAPLAGDS